MFEKNGTFTIVYFLIIGMFIKYAFVRIILAIILYNLEGLKYSKGNRYKCVSVTEFKTTVKRDFLFGLYSDIRKIFKIIINFFYCKSKNKNNLKINSLFKSKEKNAVKRNEESFKLKKEKAVEFSKEGDKNEDKYKEKSSSNVIINNEIVLGIDNENDKSKNNNKDNRNADNISIIHRKSYSIQVNKAGLTKKVLRLEDLRFVYSKYIENFEMISRNPYFDSPEDIARVNIYYEKKYETNFKRNIMYFILLIFLILSIFFNVNSPWRFGFKTLIDNLFNKIGYDNLNEISNF